MITITSRALVKLKELNTEQSSLRVAVVGGGCSGLSYKLAFESPTLVDTRVEFDGLLVVVDPKSALFLKGMELDYSDGLNGTGFNFSNPNAARSCGCGSSFSV